MTLRKVVSPLPIGQASQARPNDNYAGNSEKAKNYENWTKVDYALDAARRGLLVFPCEHDGKAPAITGWQKAATTDPETISAWFAGTADPNIGINTAGLLVVDIDLKKDGPKNFGAFVTAQKLLGNELPKTATVVTWSGGYHLYFRLPEGIRVKNSVDKLAKGVDIRTDGGLVVGPGSIVKDKAYRWLKEAGDDIALAPEWLTLECESARMRHGASGVRVCEPSEAGDRAAREWFDTHGVNMPVGGRHATCAKIGMHLYDYGVDRATCESILHEWNEHLCEPPLDEDEVAHVAASTEVNRDNPVGFRSPDNNIGFEAVELVDRRKVKPTKRKGFHLVSAKESAALALTLGAEPLIDGVLDCGGMSVLYGDSNTGKSFVAMDKGFHIATGRAWNGHAVTQGAVIWVAAEGGTGVHKRVRAWLAQHEVDDAPFYVLASPINLREEGADVPALIKLILEQQAAIAQKVQLVVIDTLSRAMAGGDENSSTDMGALVRHLDVIREAVAGHLLVVHHTGKNKLQGARGHSLLRAATDTELEIADGRITATKQRDMEVEFNRRFRLTVIDLGQNKRGKRVTSCYVELEDRRHPWPVTMAVGDAHAWQAFCAAYRTKEHRVDIEDLTFEIGDVRATLPEMGADGKKRTASTIDRDAHRRRQAWESANVIRKGAGEQYVILRPAPSLTTPTVH